MSTPAEVIRSIRPALQAANLSEAEREKFLYDLTREVYDFVKFDVHGATVDAEERTRIGRVCDAALPRPREERDGRDTPGELY